MISQLEEIERKISGLKKEIQKMHAASSSPLGVASTPASPRLRNKSPGRHVVEDATGATIFLGGNSDTPLALGCREAFTSGDSMVHEAIINQLVPRAYPFTSLWGPEASVKDVCETLPDESDIMR